MNLARMGLPYEDLDTELPEIVPANARSNRLLLVGGTPGEYAFYSSRHWKPVALVFGAGFATLHTEVGNNFLSAPASSSTPIVGDGTQCDAALLLSAASLAPDLPALLSRILPLLKPGAKIHLRLPSAWFHADLATRAGRESYPWPGTPPLGNGWDVRSLSLGGELGPFRISRVTESLDGLYHDPRQAGWNQIHAWDLDVRLPSAPVLRKACFTRWYDVELSDSDAGAASAIAPALNQEQVHAQIVALMDELRLEDAGLLLDKLHRVGMANGATWNLQGVLQFYQQDFEAAFASFRMSCTLDPSVMDPHRNLLDAAHRLQRVAEARQIILRDIPRNPQLQELLDADT